MWDNLLPKEAVPKSFQDRTKTTPQRESFLHLHLGFDAKVMWRAMERAVGPGFGHEKCEVKLLGSPLTHQRFLRRNRGTSGPAIEACKDSFPGHSTSTPLDFIVAEILHFLASESLQLLLNYGQIIMGLWLQAHSPLKGHFLSGPCESHLMWLGLIARSCCPFGFEAEREGEKLPTAYICKKRRELLPPFC